MTMRKSYSWCWDTDSATWPLYQCGESRKKKLSGTTVIFPFYSLNLCSFAVDIVLGDKQRTINAYDKDIEIYINIDDLIKSNVDNRIDRPVACDRQGLILTFE